MMQLLAAIESSAFATWVRESPSIFAYTMILSLHAIGLAIVVGLNAMVAFRLLGIAPALPLPPARKLFPVMYGGFWLNAVSGLALLTTNATALLTGAVFLVKLGFIALAVVNLRLLKRWLFVEDVPATGPVQLTGRLLAGTSLAFWAGAIVAGRLTAYPEMIEYYFG